jgi:hypothetical protein
VNWQTSAGAIWWESIRLSEGRVVAAEVIAIAPPLLDRLSNAELAAAMGADLILLNFYDVSAPQVMGFPTGRDTGKFGERTTGIGPCA